MAHNRYYIINSDDPNLQEINAVIVGTPDSQRYNLDKTKIVVKLHEGDYSEYEFLSDYAEHNHEEILILLNSPEWIGEAQR